MGGSIAIPWCGVMRFVVVVVDGGGCGGIGSVYGSGSDGKVEKRAPISPRPVS